jgi:hypothetical protein
MADKSHANRPLYSEKPMPKCPPKCPEFGCTELDQTDLSGEDVEYECQSCGVGAEKEDSNATPFPEKRG